VLDFGISKMRGSQTVKTQETALLGTPQYMAPEQATGKHDSVDQRTDIFALGAIVYEMLAGHPAFVGASIPEVVFKVVYEQPKPLASEAPTVKASVVSAVTQALSKAQEERFPTINGFVEALTGSPLPVTKQPPIPVLDGKNPTPKSGKDEAFAATVGSGDHSGSIGLVPVEVNAPTVSTGSGVVAATATGMGVGATVAAGVAATSVASTAAGVTSTVTAASGEARPIVADDAPVARKKSRAPLIAGIVAIGGLVSGGVFFAMRGNDDKAASVTASTPAPSTSPAGTPSPTTATTATSPSSSPTASTIPTPSPAATPSPTTSSSGTPSPTTSPTPTPSPATTPSPSPPATTPAKTDAKAGAKPPAKAEAAKAEPAKTEPANEDSGDETVRQQLVDAERALKSGNPALAKELANKALNHAEASTFQQSHAHAIVGISVCRAKADQETAQAELRQISVPKLRNRLMAQCRDEGVTLSPR